MSALDTFKQLAVETIKETNPETNPELSKGDWDVFTTALGALGASLQSSIQNVSNSSYPQNSSGFQVDLNLFSYGLTPRKGTTPATASITGISPTDLTLNAGTQFTSNFNGNTYTLISKTTLLASIPTNLFLQSQQQGQGFQLPTNSTLTTTVAPNISFTVTDSVDGANEEDDSSGRARNLNASQNPRGAGRKGDFESWANQASDLVTDVYSIEKFEPNTTTIGVFLLTGSSDYNNIVLDTLTLYSRLATPATITTVNDYINVQRGINQSSLVKSVSTLAIPQTIVIQVELPEGIALTTTVTNFDGTAITVNNIIKQEFRRSLVTYPTGGTPNNTTQTNVLLLSRLQQTLDSSLSFYGGVYGNLLLDRKILVDGNNINISVPYREVDLNQNLIALYDKLPADFTVELLP